MTVEIVVQALLQSLDKIGIGVALAGSDHRSMTLDNTTKRTPNNKKSLLLNPGRYLCSKSRARS